MLSTEYMHKTITILSIETSCDETAAAVIRYDATGLSVLSSVVSSQIELHAQYGGVVPNLAAREHVKNIIPVIEETLEKAVIARDDIDAIAVTQGPGLIPALLIGVSAAKTLALVWQKPLLGIHHIEGHIYANFIGSHNFQFPISNFQTNPNSKISNENPTPSVIPSVIEGSRVPQTTEPESTDDESESRTSSIEHLQSIFPLLALVVSGGHTQLVLIKDHFEYEVLGETRDDAVGEAFDKAARMLGLPYPGGPAIAERARKFQDQNPKSKTNSNSQIPNSKSDTINSVIPAKAGIQVPQTSKSLLADDASANHKSAIANLKPAITLPRPMLDSPDLDFSFSGIKTAVLYLVKKNETRKTDDTFIDEVAHEFQDAVVDVLIAKTKKAIETHSPKTVIIAGGVSANKELRTRLRNSIETNFPETTFMMPEFKYSLDNAAMIGAAAAVRFARLSLEERAQLKSNALSLDPNANLSLASLH